MKAQTTKWRIVRRDRFGREEVMAVCFTRGEAHALLLDRFNALRRRHALKPFANWGLAVTCTGHSRPVRAYPLLHNGGRCFEEDGVMYVAEPFEENPDTPSGQKEAPAVVGARGFLKVT